ncbi:hypothetical protein PVAND_007324 [Polypedilum vanderplanki]|uniref:Uncharacterized protein n=1 Tax=Polypedilum vanderplanki TaxID=319348 RepID=A0A9J6C6H7_POLVA|nr:hypothetical protein PVAND_007324 [Polypedilum vanderplanki]
MPIALVRSISLPNLKIYTTISLLLVSGCFYYAFDVVRTDPHWKIHQNLTNNYAITRPNLLKQSSDAVSALTNSEILSTLTSSSSQSVDEDKSSETVNDVNQEILRDNSNKNLFEDESMVQNDTNSLVYQLKEVAQFMTHEPICIWIAVFKNIWLESLILQEKEENCYLNKRVHSTPFIIP